MSWYESIAPFSSDYVPASFDPGPSVEANNDLLYGLRDNDFDTKNSAYMVSTEVNRPLSPQMLRAQVPAYGMQPRRGALILFVVALGRGGCFLLLRALIC